MMPKLLRNGMMIGAAAAALLLVVFLFSRTLTPAQLRGQAGNGGAQCATFGQFTDVPLTFPAGTVVQSPVAGPGNSIWFLGSQPGEDLEQLYKMTLQGALSQYPLPAGANLQRMVAGGDGNLRTVFEVQNAASTVMYSINASGQFTPFNVPFPYLQPIVGGIARTWGVSLDSNLQFHIYGTDHSGASADLYNAGTDPNSIYDNYIMTMAAAGDDSAWFTQLDHHGQGNDPGYTTQTLKCINPTGVARSIPLANMDDVGDIVSDLAGNVWGIEPRENDIAIFKVTPDGTVSRYPLPAAAQSDYNSSIKLVLGPDGNLWTILGLQGVAPGFVGRIVRVQQDGTMTMFDLESKYRTAANLFLGPDGNLWFNTRTAFVRFDLCSQPLPAMQGGCGIGGPVTASSSSGQGSSSGTTQCNNGAGTCNAIQSGGSCTTQQVTCPNGTVVAPGASVMVCQNDGCTGSCVFCQPSQGNSSSSGIGSNSSGGNNRVVTGPSVCVPQCGDSKLRLNEQCDDGNTRSNDGCSSTCVIEKGWECLRPAGTPCSVICGDGIRAGIELCDDGNKTAGDGCSALCVIEPGARCMVAGSSGTMSGASQLGSCTPTECGAQPAGGQSVLCSDGSVGGPVCQRGTGGACSWVTRNCPSVASSSAPSTSCPICPGQTPASWRWTIPSGTFQDVSVGGTNLSLLNGATWNFTLTAASPTGCRWEATGPIAPMYVILAQGSAVPTPRLTLTLPSYFGWSHSFPTPVANCSSTQTLDYQGPNYSFSIPQQQQITPVP